MATHRRPPRRLREPHRPPGAPKGTARHASRGEAPPAAPGLFSRSPREASRNSGSFPSNFGKLPASPDGAGWCRGRVERASRDVGAHVEERYEMTRCGHKMNGPLRADSRLHTALKLSSLPQSHMASGTGRVKSHHCVCLQDASSGVHRSWWCYTRPVVVCMRGCGGV